MESIWVRGPTEFIMTKTNLFDLNYAALSAFLKAMGEPAFRAKQLFQWMHQRGVVDFNAMSDMSKRLRERLSETAELTLCTIDSEHIATDGTYKWVMRLSDGNCIESVYIPEDDRGTLCVSSQVGCVLNCSFCSTGQRGFSRNLTVAEIIGQVWIAVRRLSEANGEHDRRITNVVMMGMGEPLLNFEAVVSAMDIMMDDNAYGISKRRVTLSTSGVVPMMQRLREISDVALAVSLHAPNDALRNILVPLNRKYPLAELMQTCRDYFKVHGKRRVTFEYVMLDNVNDKPEHARQLVDLIGDMNCMVNLIPFNPFPETIYKRSKRDRIDAFWRTLEAAGITCVTRKTRGDDIDAACGQLVGDVQDRTTRSQSIEQRQIKLKEQLDAFR